LTIRTADPSDVKRLARFNERMADETEDKALDAETVRAGVRHMINAPDRGFYLLAERGGKVVGSLMITTEWSDWRNGTFWWIQSVYVRPEARRQGVYASLHAEVKSRAEPPTTCAGSGFTSKRTTGRPKKPTRRSA
jgi:GNAT superfamily N-acetyltransferase